MDEKSVRRFVREEREPLTHEKVITFEQLVSRCGAQTVVVPTASMPRGRIVDAALVAAGTHPRVVVVVHPETYHRACGEAYNRWGRGLHGMPGFDLEPEAGFINGRELVVVVGPEPLVAVIDPGAPASWKNSVYEWRIRL